MYKKKIQTLMQSRVGMRVAKETRTDLLIFGNEIPRAPTKLFAAGSNFFLKADKILEHFLKKKEGDAIRRTVCLGFEY